MTKYVCRIERTRSFENQFFSEKEYMAHKDFLISSGIKIHEDYQKSVFCRNPNSEKYDYKMIQKSKTKKFYDKFTFENLCQE